VRHSRSANGGRITLAVSEPVSVIHFEVIDEGASTAPLVDDHAGEPVTEDDGRLNAIAIYDARRPELRLTLTPGAWLAAKAAIALGRFNHT
jgi:hypothetical protein